MQHAIVVHPHDVPGTYESDPIRVDAESGETFETYTPSTGEKIGDLAKAGRADAQGAVGLFFLSGALALVGLRIVFGGRSTAPTPRFHSGACSDTPLSAVP